MKSASPRCSARRPGTEWTAIFDSTDACVVPCLSPWEAHEHPHNQARSTFVEVDGVVQPAPAPRFSRTPSAVSKPPSPPGADTVSGLAEWGARRGDDRQAAGVGRAQLGDWPWVRCRLRPARVVDGPGVAAVFGAARAQMTYLPTLHTPEEDIAFFSGVVARGDGGPGDHATEVAEVDKVVVGFGAVREGWLDHLYVDPGWQQGRGIRGQLLDWAKAVRPGGLTLSVFEGRTPTPRPFAGARGLVTSSAPSGSGNEEHCVPDIKMRWSPAGSA